MNWEEEILIAEDLSKFESLINMDRKHVIDQMMMPDTLEDKKNDHPKGIQAIRGNFNLIYLILKGEQDIHIGAEHHWIRPNDLVVIPENIVYYSNPNKKCNGFCIHFKTEYILPLLNDHIDDKFPFLDVEAEHIIHLADGQSELVQHAFKDIILEYERYSLEKDFILRNYIFILLLRIREIYCSIAIERKEPGSYSNKLANRFNHLVKNNFIEIREVKQYADLLNISPGHLSDTVKKAFGKSPREIINNLLLLEAKILLGSTDHSISEIARLLRFEDQSHFNHFIKHHTGFSPKELRKKL